jgi:PAS domain S-box-containing protein
MKSKKSKKIILAISSLAIFSVILALHAVIDFWPYCIFVAILLTSVLSYLFHRYWEAEVEKRMQKEIDEKIKIALLKNHKYKKLLNHISEGLVIVSKEGLCEYANNSFCNMVGLNEIEILNSHYSKFILSELPINEHATSECILWNEKRKRIPVLISTEIISRDESLICISDLQEVKSLERSLQQSKEISSIAFKSSNVASVIIDAESKKIINANEAAALMTGYSEQELIGGSCYESFCPYNKEQCKSRLADGKSFMDEETITKKDGSIITILRTNSMISFGGKLCIFESMIDISERKRAEEKLMQKRRITSLETLASGISHEFNNINNIMKGTIDALFISGNTNRIPENVRNALVTIKSMIERGTTITGDLMVFASDKHEGCENVNLLDVIEDVVYSLQEEIEEYEVHTNTNIQGVCF